MSKRNILKYQLFIPPPKENHDDNELQCKLPNDHEEQADPMDMEQIKVCVEMFTCTELLYLKTKDIFFICPACLSISLPDRISAVVK